jgi:hypothetical protein
VENPPGQKPDAPDLRRLLREHRERPRYRRTANETDEFPSPHGFARAEDYVGDVKNITSQIEELCLEPNSGEPLGMSALGQKQTLDCLQLMSAFPPKADISCCLSDVRQVLIGDIS